MRIRTRTRTKTRTKTRIGTPVNHLKGLVLGVGEERVGPPVPKKVQNAGLKISPKVPQRRKNLLPRIRSLVLREQTKKAKGIQNLVEEIRRLTQKRILKKKIRRFFMKRGKQRIGS
jgi:hypothetical protein